MFQFLVANLQRQRLLLAGKVLFHHISKSVTLLEDITRCLLGFVPHHEWHEDLLRAALERYSWGLSRTSVLSVMNTTLSPVKCFVETLSHLCTRVAKHNERTAQVQPNTGRSKCCDHTFSGTAVTFSFWCRLVVTVMPPGEVATALGYYGCDHTQCRFLCLATCG